MKMTKDQKKNYVSIERKVRTNHNTVGRLTQLVHTIEKINSNLDDHSDSSSGRAHGTGVGIARTNGKELIESSSDDENNTKSNETETISVDKELCFKVSQLVTELLLMLFAASLLCIAAVVILSRKTPTIMESYDIVPKILFFLCVIVASISFLRWLMTKFKSIFKHNSNQNLVKTQKISNEIGSKRLISHKKGMAEQFIKLKSQDRIDQIQKAMAIPGTAAIVSAGMATSILGDRILIPPDLLHSKNVDTNYRKNIKSGRYSDNKSGSGVLESGYCANTVTNGQINFPDRLYECPSTSTKNASHLVEVSMEAPRELLNDQRSTNVSQLSNYSIKFNTIESIIDEETSSTNGNYS